MVATNAVVLALISHFLSRPDTFHLLSVAALAVPWSLVTALHLASGLTRTTPRLLVISLITLLVAGTAGLYAPQAILAARNGVHPAPVDPALLVRNGARSIIALSPTEARDDRQMIRYVNEHAARSDKIFVGLTSFRHTMYSETVLYYLLDVRPASRYLEMVPGVETTPAVQQSIARSLRDCRWVVLWRGGFWYEPNASQTPGSPFLDRYIARHYRPVLADTTYVVLVQRERPQR